LHLPQNLKHKDALKEPALEDFKEQHELKKQLPKLISSIKNQH